MSITTRLLKTAAAACAVAALVLPAANAQLRGGPADTGLVLYDLKNFGGEAIEITGPVPRMSEARFNDRTSSIQVLSGRWEVCTDGNFRGRCDIISRDTGDLSFLGLHNNISSIRPAGTRRGGGGEGRGNNRGAPLTLFSGQNFTGQAIPIDGDIARMSSIRFNDRAASLRVNSGTWIICSDGNYRGRCEYVDSNVRDLSVLGLRGNISSVGLSDGRGDRPRSGYGGDGPRGGADRNEGIEGARSVFFPRPTYRGNAIDYRRGAATDFCRSQGLGKALHVDENRRGRMIDVLCEK